MREHVGLHENGDSVLDICGGVGGLPDMRDGEDGKASLTDIGFFAPDEAVTVELTSGTRP